MTRLLIKILPLEPILQLQWQVLLLVRRRHRRGSCFVIVLGIPHKIPLTTLNVNLVFAQKESLRRGLAQSPKSSYIAIDCRLQL